MILDQNLVPNDIPSYLRKMKEMYEDLFSGGKAYRGALVFSISKELGLLKEKAELLSTCIEYIHNSSLLHDDFVDDAKLRRGKTAVWKKYGGGYAILGGDYLLAKVIKNLCAHNSIKLIAYTSSVILALVEGEWLQDACHNRGDVSKEEMSYVHALKTSALFSWCFKAPALLMDESLPKKDLDQFQRIGEVLGALLQRSDDLLDYNIRNGEGKAYFKDLPSGYFNLFTIHLLKDLSLDEKMKAFDCKSLQDFIKIFNINMSTALKGFDQESEAILAEVMNLIDENKFFSRKFKQELKEATYKIYWRSKV